MPGGPFTEEGQSTALFLLGDLAMRNYQALNNDVDIAIGTFERLKSRIEVLSEEHQPLIRNDLIANNYIESLNRMRDCYEQHLADKDKRALVVKYVLRQFQSNESFHDEIVYLLFLYLTRLGTGEQASSVLLNSIILKDHNDIKIKKEATRQIDQFAAKTEVRILRPFLRDIDLYLQRNELTHTFHGSL